MRLASSFLATLFLLGSPFATFADEGGAATRLLVVSGLGGDDRFSEAFVLWADTLVEAATASGVAETVYLAEDPELSPRASGKSGKDQVLEALAALQEKSGPEDITWVVLIGHGSFRDGSSRLNLPGPDLTDRDYAAALDGFRGKIVFVNTASASGGFLRSLAAENRVVVTATKSPTQRNESVFGGKFAEAFRESLADGDQNGNVSVLEAFEYARQEVARHYETKNLMVTEQALLDDDGNGEGSNTPNALGSEESGGDGLLAARLELTGPTAASASGGRRAELQDQLDQLRRQKDSLEPEVYESELERLLLEIARLDRQERGSADGEVPE
ncbi:MAG: hypothetical protein AAGA81_20890 [Acidobacteriota bacterium]